MKILSKLNNPFIANISFAFNDRDNLYLGMDYLPGGDLRSYLS
jgi:serine/threonine protein kinase